MKRETKKITQGAMIVAMLGILFVIDRQSAGLFDYMMAWIIPLPFVVYGALYGLKDTLVPYVASIFLSIILATPVLVIYTIMYGSIGLIYGYGVSKRWQGRHLFFSTIVGSTIVFFITMLLFASFFGFSVVEDIELIKEILDTLPLPDQLDIQQFITMTLIITYTTYVIMEAYFLHMLSKIVLSRFKVALTPSKPITSVRISKPFGWLMLAGLFIYPSAKLLQASDMVLTITFAIYCWIIVLLLYQAFVFVIIVQRRFKLKFLVASIIVGLLLAPTLLVDILTIIGLLDILTNIRMRVIGVRDHA